MNENSEARSMFTPVTTPGPTADPNLDAGDFPWGVEQSFQAQNFNYFTTKEVRYPCSKRLSSQY